MSDSADNSRPSLVAYNLRRLMAREALTYDDVVAATGLDARTLRGILHAKKRPHARTLNRLAEGLGVAADELFTGDPASAHTEEFDAATNPAIEAAVAEEPNLFADWTPVDFAELASRFGSGGALTPDGVREAAGTMNANRQTLRRACVLLESDQAAALRSVIDALYDSHVQEGDHADA